MTKQLISLALIGLMVLILSCSKKKDTAEPEKEDMTGKIVITDRTYAANEDLYIFNLSVKNDPKKLVFKMTNGKFKFSASLPLGAASSFKADKNWPTSWTSVRMIPEFQSEFVNNDKPEEVYDYHYSTIRTYESFFGNLPPAWKVPGKISGGASLYEAYIVNYSNNSIYFDVRSQQYLYVKGGANQFIDGYKISDLVKKPNGNMDADPIDWSKADLIFSFNTTYNGKDVSQIVFVDLNTNTYASFVRNKLDDPVNGADKGRQTLLTTQWEPVSNLFEGWPLN
ncbi:hypothetical protein SAMN04487898_12438 [Pedobacter sp. ok626]|uniref:hypothetical protein n=1 Tax=Pedobacter sp. ok626 TaxID=1761882 RepID=UPI000887B36B|nr:hypothetical protein [Pedobacter sp. ok626]SDL75679.1 hypothetical protein SAMN04487898_12438 [Pedobacter sp. ok626]